METITGQCFLPREVVEPQHGWLAMIFFSSPSLRSWSSHDLQDLCPFSPRCSRSSDQVNTSDKMKQLSRGAVFSGVVIQSGIGVKHR